MKIFKGRHTVVISAEKGDRWTDLLMAIDQAGQDIQWDWTVNLRDQQIVAYDPTAKKEEHR